MGTGHRFSDNYLEELHKLYCTAKEEGASDVQLAYLRNCIENEKESLRKAEALKNCDTFSDFCGCFCRCSECPLFAEKQLSGRACKKIWEEERGKECVK